MLTPMSTMRTRHFLTVAVASSWAGPRTATIDEEGAQRGYLGSVAAQGRS